ncbi:MAG: SDR family NAD(P)-dependent oxidoreductase [Nanoarchaeota archaeon]
MKKITLVTGASSGLGKDIARRLCKNGHIVYVTARRKNELINLQKKCSNYNGEIKIISGDLSNKNFRENAVSQILKEEGKIDYLINNAGFGKVISFEKQSVDEIQKMFDLNVVAYLHLTNLVLKNMLKRNKGKIIHIGSVATFVPRPYYTIYNSTKSAIYTFNRSLKFELKKTNVSSSMVLVPKIKTDFAQTAFENYNVEKAKKYISDFNKSAEDSEIIAKKIIKKLNSNKEIIIPNFRAFICYLSRYFPEIVDFILEKFFIKKNKN